MSSTGADFRNLTPLVLMDALRQAGTQVYEPIHRFRLEIPADTHGAVLPVLARLGAVPEAPSAQGAAYVVGGTIPAARSSARCAGSRRRSSWRRRKSWPSASPRCVHCLVECHMWHRTKQ